MLVLSRKAQQRILIGGDVVVTVLQIRGNHVRIGIEAPKAIHVLRSELQDVTTLPPTAVVAAVVASIDS